MPILYRIKSRPHNFFNPLISESNYDFFDISTTAIKRIINYGKDYAYTRAPLSPLKELSGNIFPDLTRLFWLRNKNKSNQFVGDVLTESGYATPTFRMKDGRLFYKTATAFPKETAFFKKLPSNENPHSGDLFVIDYDDKSDCTDGHIEIIIAADLKHNILTLAGVHHDGAHLSNKEVDLNQWKYNKKEICWSDGKDKFFFLRAIKRIV